MKSVLVLTLAPFCASPLLAQNFLDPLVVTATRGETKLARVPYSASVFSAEDFQRNTARTLPDALRLTPGVLVQKTTHGHGSPFIRGFTGRQNVFLIDGVRFNNSTFRGGPVQYWNTVDPFSLSGMELIRSQGSVLYGSDAAGGTLNAFSKASGYKEQTEGQLFSHGSAYYEYRSNGQGSHLGRIESQSGVGGKFGLHLGVSAKEFGDIEDSSVGLMRGTGYPEQAIDGRFDWAISPQSELTFLHQNLNQDGISRWHRTTKNPGWNHDGHVAAPGTFIANDFDQERSLSYLRLNHQNDESNAVLRRVKATLSYQTSAESEFQIRTLTDKRRQAFEVDTTGFDLELESPLADGSLTYGFDMYHDSLDSTASRNTGSGYVFRPGDRPVGNDACYDLLGAYAQYIRPFGEKFELSGGLRYTHARAEIGQLYDSAKKQDVAADHTWDNLSVSLRGTYQMNETGMIFGGVSQAFRAPNLNDLSGNLTSRSGISSLGSLDVEPEKFITSEIGYRQDLENFGWSAAVFHTQISDNIIGVPVSSGSKTEVTTNASDGYVYGVELEGYWNISSQWILSGFASWQDGRTESPLFVGGSDSSQHVSRLLPLNGSLALRWQHPTHPLWIEGRVLAFAEADRLSRADREDIQRIPTGGTPGYLVGTLRAGWQIHQHCDLTFAIENLTDQDYRHHGSGQNETGFGAVLGARVSW
jgi:hemoglobin/transferrin/lactoferrin receptor protein